jgi:hypothetical protein
MFARQRKYRKGLPYSVNVKMVKSGATEILPCFHLYKGNSHTKRNSLKKPAKSIYSEVSGKLFFN